MRRTDQEEWLDHAGIQWRYVEAIEFEKFRMVGHNQVRFQTDDDRVLAIAEQIKAGHMFPPIVLEEDGKPGPRMIDGFHRYDAYVLADVTATDAYLTQPLSEFQRAWLTTVFNVRNGMTPTLEERLQSAVNLIRLGLDQKTAAREAGVSPKTLSGRLAEGDARERLTRLGLARIAKSAGHTMMLTLSRIKNPNVFKAAAEAFFEAGDKSSSTYNDLIVEVNRSDMTEADQLRTVSTWKTQHRTAIAATLKGIKPSSITTRLSYLLSSILNLRLDRFDPKSVSADDRARFRTYCIKALEVLDRLEKSLA